MIRGFNIILRTILEICVLVFNYIYDFLFDWEDDEVYDLENEKLKHSVNQDKAPIAQTVERNSTIAIHNKTDFDNLKKAFGKSTADYIVRLRQDVDTLVKEHGLIQEHPIVVTITPENFRNSLLSPEYFETTLERIYSQFNKDVILKPGNIRVMHTSSGAPYAEVQIETYTITEEVLASV